METVTAEQADEKTNTTGESGAPAGTRIPYLAGIDGLRAIAVIAVVFYHAQFAWMPGGFLGVEVFFVISGYLITGLLLSEWSKTNHLNLGRFWFRRARRLLPAVFVLILATLVIAVLFLPGEVASLRFDALAAAAYVSNWYQIFSHKSYFEAIGRPSLLRHLWSLAVEEQFYVVWPLLLLAALRWLRPRWKYTLPLLVFALAIASTLLMAALYQPDADPSRIYYGTDTRAAGFLIGAALAMVLAPGRSMQAPPKVLALLFDVTGLVALLGLIAIFVLVSEINPYLYLGGFAVVAMLTAAVIVSVVYPRTRLMPGLLGMRVLRLIGLRSYSIYLWHWPVIDLTRPYVDVPFGGLPLFLVQVASTLVLAELSYRFIERPIREGALGRLWGNLRKTQRHTEIIPWAAGSVIALVLCVALGISVVNARTPDIPAELSDAQPTATPAQVAAIASPTGQTVASVSTATPRPDPTSVLVTTTPPDPRGTPFQPFWPYKLVLATPAVSGTVMLPTGGATAIPATVAIKPSVKPSATPPSVDPVLTPTGVFLPAETPVPQKTVTDVFGGNYHILAIGDSVMLGAANELEHALGGAEVNAVVSRQAAAAIRLLQSRYDAGTLGDIVILHIGNNGYVTQKQFDQMMQIVQNVPIVAVVNIRVPLRWEVANNTLFADSIKNYPNAVLVDWYSASNLHPDLFTPDGVHLQPAARQVYANTIVTTIKAFIAQGHPLPTIVATPSQ